MYTPPTNLKDRAADALLVMAALELDPGGAGYAKGQAENFRDGRYDNALRQRPEHERGYIQRVERAAAEMAYGHGIAEVRVRGASIQVRRPNGTLGSLICCDRHATAKRIAERLRLLGAEVAA
jgi:hypothetical protein